MRAIRKYFQKYWKYKIQQTKEELNTMKIGNDIYYVGVNDHQVDLFEGQYVVPNGMSYNSYVIKDEKIAVMDTVDAGFTEEWLGKVAEVLDGAKPDYLVVQHMEPDHAANIENFMKAYPDTTVVANTKTFTMMENFFRGMNLEGKKLVVANGDTLTLGKHVLTFVFAPMVHWPEVMVTYDSTDKVLFSADGFGKFGALDVEEDWDCEARRYYIGIVGKYGPQVQKLLKAAICLLLSCNHTVPAPLRILPTSNREKYAENPGKRFRSLQVRPTFLFHRLPDSLFHLALRSDYQLLSRFLSAFLIPDFSSASSPEPPISALHPPENSSPISRLADSVLPHSPDA